MLSNSHFLFRVLKTVHTGSMELLDHSDPQLAKG